MIAICLSTYNGSQFLHEQLDSLVSQNCNDFSIIARDDGSSDQSYEILKQFAKNSSIPIELLEDQTNLGVKKSFELLMYHALEMGAEYIMFCDQDDVWHPNKVSKTMAMMQQMESSAPNPSILVHSDVSVVDRDLVILHNSFWKFQHIDPAKDALNRLLLHNTVTGCTTMINRALALKVSNIPNEAVMHDWWSALVASAFGQIGYIDEPLMLYRQHGGNDTGAKKYGLGYWLDRLLKKPSLDKYVVQAGAFLEIYRNELSQEQRAMLEDFSILNQKNWFQRRLVLIKYGIFKNGWIRNIGLMVFV
jgi:glycosyltransferase involved in cell wall biosynthesis